MNEDTQELLYDDSNIKNSTTSKCPGCGANLEFDPKTQSKKCQHCGYEQTFEMQKAAEEEFSKLFEANNEWASETQVIKCENCGAKEIISKKEIAKECSFCGTSNITLTEELSGLKPSSVVPFKITQKEVIGISTNWAKKKFLAPKQFKIGFKPEDISGIYSPSFTFDSDTFSRYSGKLGKYYSRTVTRNGKTVTIREIRWFSISGNYSCFFDDVIVDASSNITQKTLTELKPFGTNDAKQYTNDYLYGFKANQYSKDGLVCWEEAKVIMKGEIKKGILTRYAGRYDVVGQIDIETTHSDMSFKYLLIPIYVGHSLWKTKIYNFFVNGATGKITGKTPISVIKVTILTAIVLVVIAAIVFALYQTGFIEF